MEMRANVLLAGSPAPHRHSPQGPAKEQDTSGQTRSLGSQPWSRKPYISAATSTSRSGDVGPTRSGAAAAETAATTPMMTVMMPNSMNGAMPAHRERKQVSACVCARMAPQAEMCIYARARAGVPLRASPLSPFGETLRTQFRGWDPSERRAGLHTRECTPSRATQRLEHDVDAYPLTITRTLFARLSQAVEVESARDKHANAMRKMRGHACIEERVTYEVAPAIVAVPKCLAQPHLSTYHQLLANAAHNDAHERRAKGFTPRAQSLGS
jgi:hypothetical protein